MPSWEEAALDAAESRRLGSRLRPGDAEKLAVSVDTSEQRRGLAVRQINTKLVVTAMLFLVLLVLLALFAPSFFRNNNLINVLVQTSSLGLMAIGMAPVMIAGGIDLSIPANMALPRCSARCSWKPAATRWSAR